MKKTPSPAERLVKWLAGAVHRLLFRKDADLTPFVAGVINGGAICLAFFATFIVWGITGTLIANLFGPGNDLLLIPTLLVLGLVLMIAWAAVSRRLTSRVVGAVGVPSSGGNMIGFFGAAVFIYLVISLFGALVSLGSGK